MEIILFQPPTWQPVVIHSRHEEKALLAVGYRREKPQSRIDPPLKESKEKEIIRGVEKPKQKTTIERIGSDVSVSIIRVNRMTARELSDNIPGVGLVTARKIINNRPYKTVEDLFAVTDKVKWANLWIDYSEADE